MKFTAVLVVVVACASLSAGQPTLLTKKLLKKFVLPRYLSGGGSFGLPELHLPKLPSLYLPFPFTSLWPSKPEPAPSVVYHSLSEEEAKQVYAVAEVQDGSYQDTRLQAVEGGETYPVPEAEKTQVYLLEDVNAASQVHPNDVANEIDLRAPVYVAETPAVRHVAPLPAGYLESVHIKNLQPAPGTL